MKSEGDSIARKETFLVCDHCKAVLLECTKCHEEFYEFNYVLCADESHYHFACREISQKEISGTRNAKSISTCRPGPDDVVEKTMTLKRKEKK